MLLRKATRKLSFLIALLKSAFHSFYIYFIINFVTRNISIYYDRKIASTMKNFIYILTLLICAGCTSNNQSIRPEELDFSKALLPIRESVFEDSTYYIWGASPIKGEDGKYHLFYSRWKKEHGFEAWVSHSEIAHAVSDNLFGPYKHHDVALEERGTDFWDGRRSFHLGAGRTILCHRKRYGWSIYPQRSLTGFVYFRRWYRLETSKTSTRIRFASELGRRQMRYHFPFGTSSDLYGKWIT